MALVLALEEGQSIYVGDDRVLLEKIYSPSRFRLKVEGSAMDALYEITESERTEIFPDVYVQAGFGGNMRTVKIAIEAAPHKLILREKLYNADKQQSTR